MKKNNQEIEIQKVNLKFIESEMSRFESEGDLESAEIYRRAADQIRIDINNARQDNRQLLLPMEPSSQKAEVFRGELYNPLSIERKVYGEMTKHLCDVIGNRPHSNMRDAIEEFVRKTGSASPREMLSMMYKNGTRMDLRTTSHYLNFIGKMAENSTPVMPIALMASKNIPPFMGADITEFAMRLNEEGIISPNSGMIRNYFDEMDCIEKSQKDVNRIMGLGMLPSIDEEMAIKIAICIVPEERLKLIAKYEKEGYVEF